MSNHGFPKRFPGHVKSGCLKTRQSKFLFCHKALLHFKSHCVSMCWLWNGMDLTILSSQCDPSMHSPFPAVFSGQVLSHLADHSERIHSFSKIILLPPVPSCTTKRGFWDKALFGNQQKNCMPTHVHRFCPLPFYHCLSRDQLFSEWLKWPGLRIQVAMNKVIHLQTEVLKVNHTDGRNCNWLDVTSRVFCTSVSFLNLRFGHLFQ